MLLSDSTVKLASETLYVSCELVTESRSVAVTEIAHHAQLFSKVGILETTGSVQM